MPLVAADIITICEAIGERRRTQVRKVTDRRVKKFVSKYGHNVEFVPYVDPPTCKPCRNAVYKGEPMPDACPRCGLGSGSYRCIKCVRRS